MVNVKSPGGGAGGGGDEAPPAPPLQPARPHSANRIVHRRALLFSKLALRKHDAFYRHCRGRERFAVADGSGNPSAKSNSAANVPHTVNTSARKCQRGIMLGPFRNCAKVGAPSFSLRTILRTGGEILDYLPDAGLNYRFEHKHRNLVLCRPLIFSNPLTRQDGVINNCPRFNLRFQIVALHYFPTR